MNYEQHVLEEIYQLKVMIAEMQKRLDNLEYQTKGVLVLED